MPGTRLALFLVLACLAATGPRANAQGAPPAPRPAGGDSLSSFLKGLADSTDATYGAQSVDFDTTGLDSIAAWALDRPEGAAVRRSRSSFSLFPVLRYHRAEGPVLGGGFIAGSPKAGVLEMRGSYGFDNKGGRYVFDYRRTLWRPGRRLTQAQNLLGGRIGFGTRLDMELRYARETVGFMPEHADPDLGAIGAFMSGTHAQSVYETRGFLGTLTLWAGDWRLRAGYHDGKDRTMPLETRWSLFGAEDRVPPNTAARDESYQEPFGGIAFRRTDWEFAATLDGRAGGSDRWRLRGVVGKAFRLGSTIKAVTQVEAGATAANAPRQRRFELGGAKLVPSLPYGVGGTDHLLAGKLELVGSQNIVRALGIQRPDWLILQPVVFADMAADWDDPGGRDVVFSKPPSQAWRGAAGLGLAMRVGFPEPDVFWRMRLAWPIGPDSGEIELNFTLGRSFDLVGPL